MFKLLFSLVAFCLMAGCSSGPTNIYYNLGNNEDAIDSSYFTGTWQDTSLNEYSDPSGSENSCWNLVSFHNGYELIQHFPYPYQSGQIAYDSIVYPFAVVGHDLIIYAPNQLPLVPVEVSLVTINRPTEFFSLKTSGQNPGYQGYGYFTKIK